MATYVMLTEHHICHQITCKLPKIDTKLKLSQNIYAEMHNTPYLLNVLRISEWTVEKGKKEILYKANIIHCHMFDS